MNEEIHPHTVVDVIGEICPIPLIETRKALSKMNNGEIIEVIGTHEASKKEIPMAAESSGNKVLKVFEEEGVWHIFIEKV
jgi:tRNA 2-thiouridine synthesizing protein A